MNTHLKCLCTFIKKKEFFFFHFLNYDFCFSICCTENYLCKKKYIYQFMNFIFGENEARHRNFQFHFLLFGMKSYCFFLLAIQISATKSCRKGIYNLKILLAHHFLFGNNARTRLRMQKKKKNKLNGIQFWSLLKFFLKTFVSFIY
jgi:hypothetical protein